MSRSGVNPAVYARGDRPAVEGYFYGEREDCRILRDLREVVATGRTVEIEDALEPAIRLGIGRDILGHDKAGNGDPADFFEMLVVVQAGGHGRAASMAGAARRPGGLARRRAGSVRGFL